MRLMVLAAAAAGILCTPAVAQTFPEPAGYDNRGQCQNAFMRERNKYRNDPTIRHPNDRDLTPSEYNAADRENWECVQGADGRWYFVHQ